MKLSSAAIYSFTITGDPSGGSFALDDLSLNLDAPKPAPSFYFLWA